IDASWSPIDLPKEVPSEPSSSLKKAQSPETFRQDYGSSTICRDRYLLTSTSAEPRGGPILEVPTRVIRAPLERKFGSGSSVPGYTFPTASRAAALLGGTTLRLRGDNLSTRSSEPIGLRRSLQVVRQEWRANPAVGPGLALPSTMICRGAWTPDQEITQR